LWKQKILIMAIPVAAIGAIAGLASAGINAYASYRDRRRAERALAALGPRKSLTIPKEILAAYQERLSRSKRYQGFTQPELNQMRSAQARQQATLTNRAFGLGSSPMALQAIAANNAAAGWQDVAVRNAAMNRQGQAADRSAADALAGQVSQFGFGIQQADDAYRTETERRLGGAIAQQNENIGQMFSGIGQFGMTMATDADLWKEKLFT
jgi:hypothetical protein